MVCAGCVFVAGIHPSRTWTSASFESVRWNACVPLFIFSSERVFGGMEFEPMLTPREKSPLPENSPEEDRTSDAVDSEPKHYQWAIPTTQSHSICHQFDALSSTIQHIKFERNQIINIVSKLLVNCVCVCVCVCERACMCKSVLFCF